MKGNGVCRHVISEFYLFATSIRTTNKVKHRHDLRMRFRELKETFLDR